MFSNKNNQFLTFLKVTIGANFCDFMPRHTVQGCNGGESLEMGIEPALASEGKIVYHLFLITVNNPYS